MDGKRIVYRVAGPSRAYGFKIWPTAKEATLTTDYDNFPAWSPKGDLIEFTSFRDGDFGDLYYQAGRPLGFQRLDTHEAATTRTEPWSPDGEWIVFSSSRLGWKDEALERRLWTAALRGAISRCVRMEAEFDS